MRCLHVFLSILIFSIITANPAQAGPSQSDPVPEELPKIVPGKELTLIEALRIANRRNLSIEASRTTVIQAQAQLKSSWGLLLPQANATATFIYNDHANIADTPSGRIVIAEQTDLRGDLIVSMPLINPQSWHNISLQSKSLEAAELSIESARQNLLLSVAQAYYQALTARTLIAIHRNQIQSSRRHLTVATVRHQSGTGQRLDAIRAKTELLTAYEELLNAHTGLENARDALAVLLNLDEMPLPVEESGAQPPELSERQLVSLALQHREDIKYQRALVEIADSQITAGWMQFVPSLQAQWKSNYTLNPSDFGSKDDMRWFITLSLSIPIFDYTRYADLDFKRAELYRAQLHAQQTELEAQAEVRKARREYLTAKAQVDTAQTKADLARQSLQLAESAYENGTGNSLEVTDARRVSRSADIDLAVKDFLSQLSMLNLLRAIGTDMLSVAG